MTASQIMPQLIDEPAWLALWEEAGMGWTNGESIAQADHPRHGLITGIYCREGVFIVSGRYLDSRASQAPVSLRPYGELIGPTGSGDTTDPTDDIRSTARLTPAR